MKKLYFDFDGTIIDSISTITKMYNEDFCEYPGFIHIYPCEVNTWDFAELNCASRDYINTYFNQPRFFQRIEYMDNAEEVLDTLKNNFEITIVSMGFLPNLRLKKQWIKENMPYASFVPINLEYYNDKSHVDMSDGILFDDSMKNLYTSKANKKICFGDIYPWNDGWKGTRLYNWKDVERYLMKGVKI